MMEYGKNLFLESDILQVLAKTSGKIALHVKAVGVIQNPDKEDEVWDFYYGKIPTNLLNVLMQYKEAYCFLDTNEEALNAYDEWFPSKSLLLEEEGHYFIRLEIISADGTIHAVNE